MALDALQDPRVRNVRWRDLCSLTRREVCWELCLPLPWLAASLALAQLRLWLPALACSFMFFLCGLRQAHNAFHRALGISSGAHECVLYGLSLLMLGSLHAVRWNHLRHHRHCMDESDAEAFSARLPAWQALLLGPWFPFLLHRTALRLGGARLRGGIAAELAGTLAVIGLALALPGAVALRYHVIAMAVGHCLASFFAVWTVHHGCDPSEHAARTIRSRWKGLVTYNMFFHLEHHLFPAVPTCHLPLLAERLDRAAPELAARRVF